MLKKCVSIVILLAGLTLNCGLAGERHRVIVSTDIGGTDPDDFQSMVHLLVYADCFDIERLISSPFGPGRKQHILDVIDCYEKDYVNMNSWSDRYPPPDALRAITKQGETEAAPYSGVREPTEGSRWIIEANSTYRGWFTGGDQSGERGNKEFVRQHIAGHGALGEFFNSKLDAIRMGDTPSVGWLLRGTPKDPTQPSWGGQFVRAWERPSSKFHRLTTTDDQMEVFGILELVLPLGVNAPDKPNAQLVVENQSLRGHAPGDGTMQFRFCPKATTTYRFTIHSNDPTLDGKTGGITAVATDTNMAAQPSGRFPNWWTDDPSPGFAERDHDGAKTVSRWRTDYLRDFAERMHRCQTPNRLNR